VAVGRQVRQGEPLAIVHAADSATADTACLQIAALVSLGDAPPANRPVLGERIQA
jgi:thymidine phosphorylase